MDWIGGPLFGHSNGQRWASSNFKSTYSMCNLPFVAYSEEPMRWPRQVQPLMMEPLATALMPGFIILGCTDEEADQSQVTMRRAGCVRAEHLKLKLQNMDWTVENSKQGL
jgi:hypothetical protein